MTTSSEKGFESKRKGAGVAKTDESIPRLRRRVSMGDLTASPFTPDSKKTFSLPELMEKGLQDPNAAKDMAMSMLSYIQPKIEEKNEETVKKAIVTTFARTISKCVKDAMSLALSNFKMHVVDPLDV